MNENKKDLNKISDSPVMASETSEDFNTALIDSALLIDYQHQKQSIYEKEKAVLLKTESDKLGI